jgi:hypothetical protein
LGFCTRTGFHGSTEQNGPKQISSKVKKTKGEYSSHNQALGFRTKHIHVRLQTPRMRLWEHAIEMGNSVGEGSRFERPHVSKESIRQ